MKRSTRRRLPLLLLLGCTPLVVSHARTGAPETPATGTLLSAPVPDGPTSHAPPAAARPPSVAPPRRGAVTAKRAPAPDPQVARDVVVLNGQGYNYGADQKANVARLHEALREAGAEPAEASDPR